MGDIQIGIRTTAENKEFFNQLEGKNQHEKFELLKELYYKNFKKEDDEFNVNSYIEDTQNTLNNLVHIIKGLENSVIQYKKRIYQEYVVDIGQNIKEIEDILREKDENARKVKILMEEREKWLKRIDESHFEVMSTIVENDKLEDKNKALIEAVNDITIKYKKLEEEKGKIIAQIDSNNRIYDGFVKDLQSEIAELNNKNFNLIKELDKYKKNSDKNVENRLKELEEKNNELIKANKKLMMENTNLLIRNDSLEDKIKPKNSTKGKSKKGFK